MQYWEEAIEKISEIVKFDSSLAARTDDAPFGQGAADCLAYFLSLANELGFETKNYDNYIGEVIFGEGEEDFAILCHLDVVPAGDGWTKPPFGGVIEDEKIWGRGTVDDKGPAICCLFAMKELKDKGFVPSKKIKLIVGCNEECGWKCIEHYKKVAELPETGFSPDANFPVIYAEKGILHLRMNFPMKDAPFTYLVGGKSTNMVCDYCEAVPLALKTKRAKEFGLDTTRKKIISHGKSAHASTPELGQNAILPILRYFAEASPEVQHIIDCLFNDVYEVQKLQDKTGNLTMSPNLIKFRRDLVHVTVDIRYPATLPLEEVLSAIDKFGVKYETLHAQAPLFHDKESKLVTTLAEVYKRYTGTYVAPVAIGGGTYARALSNCVGFGPEIPNMEYRIHQADEYIECRQVKFLLEIYEMAIEELTK